MRSFALLAVLAIASACSTTTTVRGSLLVDVGDVRPTEYEYEATESHSTTGLAVLCLLTFHLYGGACWAYLALPFDDHEAIAVANANLDVVRIGKCAALMNPVVTGGGPSGQRRWTVRRGGADLNPLDVNRLCDPRPAPTLAPAAAPPPETAAPPPLDPAS